jgi:hypothetical protein
MIEAILIIVSQLFCFCAGWKFREIVAMKKIDKLNREIERGYAEAMKKSVIDIKIEVNDGIIFVYDKNTSAYMAHASTKEEIEHLLRTNFPGKVFNCAREELDLLTNEKAK